MCNMYIISIRLCGDKDSMKKKKHRLEEDCWPGWHKEGKHLNKCRTFVNTCVRDGAGERDRPTKIGSGRTKNRKGP